MVYIIFLFFRVFSVCHDASSRFIKLLTIHSPQGRDYVEELDLIPLVQVYICPLYRFRPRSTFHTFYVVVKSC
jgi:hypothetical protein